MRNIINFFTGRPVSVIMLVLAVLMGGIYSAGHLPLDRMPEIIYPRITVETSYPGMNASILRTAVSIPLEDSLSAIKGLTNIKSISRDGSSLILLDFSWGTNPARAASLVREAIDTVYPSLPFGVSKPIVISGNPFEEVHAIVAVRSKNGDHGFAGRLAEYEIRARLRRIEGAGAVILSGRVNQEVQIIADSAFLAARSLSAKDLAEIISYETSDFPAGFAREGRRELTIVSSGRLRSVQEFLHLILPSQSGPFRLGDLASVNVNASPRESLFIFNGDAQAALEVYRRPGANPVDLSRDIKKAIDESNLFFSNDAEITLVYDSAPFIISNVNNLLISALCAAVIVILLLAVFLKRISSGLLAALSLPFSACAAIIALMALGLSINAMSLGGLALGIGLVSDVSVIIIDLFHKNSIQSRKTKSMASKSALINDVSFLASSVSLSSMSGALTTMIVFVPVIFLPGPLGALFRDLAITVVISVAAGWFYAQFCLPSLFCFFVSGKNNGNKCCSGMGKLEMVYNFFLVKTFRKPVMVFSLTALLCIIGIGFFLLLPVEFIAPDSISELHIIAEFPPGIPPDEAVNLGIGLSGVLSEIQDISFHFGKMGAETDDIFTRSDPDYIRERLIFRSFLKSGSEVENVIYNIKDALNNYLINYTAVENNIPVIYVVYPPDSNARILGLSSALTLAVKGSSPEETNERADMFEKIIKERSGALLEDLSIRPFRKRQDIRLFPRREQLAVLGVSVSDIASAVFASSDGYITGNIEIEGRSVNIRVSSITEYPGRTNSLENRIGNIPVIRLFNDQYNMPLSLSSLVDIERIESQTILLRNNRSDTMYIDLFPSGREGGKVQSILNNIFSEYGQSISRADESIFSIYSTALISTVVLVLILLYLLLGAQFESFTLPLILMLSMIFSLAGAGPALFLSGSYLDSSSVLGLVALFGISVNNGIVFFEISEEKVRSGLSPLLAVYRGAVLRFRPVLLTTLTTIFALIPLLVSPLGNSQRSMAFTMIGGIIISGFIAFFVFPSVYVIYFNRRRLMKND